jgi:Ca2+-binding RTX toxin-like protein
MAYSVTGTNGNDTINQSSSSGPGTIVGLAGNDLITTGTGLVTVSGDSGRDAILVPAGFATTGTISGGSDNDDIENLGTGALMMLGNDGRIRSLPRSTPHRKRSSAATIRRTAAIPYPPAMRPI